MAFKSRVSSLDFKPKQKKRQLKQLIRPLRWHWIVLGISAFTATALLFSTKEKTKVIPERSASQQLPNQPTPHQAAAIRTLELSIPKLQGTTVNDDSSALPIAIPEPAANHLAPNATPRSTPPAVSSLPAPPDIGSKQLKAAVSTTQTPNWSAVVVESGDTLAAIFKRQGLSSKDVYDVIHAGDESAQALARLFPGDKLWLRTSPAGTLLAVRRKLGATKMLTLSREGVDADFQATLTEHQPEHRIAHATAIIHGSLYQAAVKAGLNEKLIMELAGIFGWDIDFAHDIRNGDSFAIAYLQYYKKGEKIRNGDIIAAEFTNQGKRYRAVRYTDPSGRTGYYTPDGKSMRKAFLRTPVDFRRISSHFSMSRCHPILHVCRPHEGTDFAAPMGTPIHAAGDGVVVFAGRKGGYGNAIILQHSHGYSTLYGHMHRIRKGIHAGMQVVQGQIIGYVGQTGLATGPHLHYEFRVNGVPKDVLRVAMPDAKPINSRYLADFKAKTLPRLAQLTVITRTQLARNEGD